MAVVVDLVVGGECDEATKAEAEREEDLGGGLEPDVGIEQLGPLDFVFVCANGIRCLKVSCRQVDIIART